MTELTPAQVPPPIERVALAILERNIEMYPTFGLSGKAGDTLDFVSGDTRWTVENVPGPGARDMYVALCHLYNEARRPVDRRVYTTLPELARLMGVQRGGKQWALLAKHIEDLKRIQITARHAFMRNGARETRIIFNILDKVTLTSPVTGDSNETTVIVEFSDDWALSIQSGYSRLMDASLYFALSRPLSRALFSVLDARRYRGSDRVRILTIPLHELRDRVNLQAERPAHVKGQLTEAHAELRREGFLAHAEWGRTGLPGRGLETWNVTYTFSDAEQIRLPLARDEESARRPEQIRELVELLQDAKSTGFIARVVAALSEEQVVGLIGDVRELLRGSTDLPSVRRIFTATAKRRAAESGVTL